MIGVATLRIKWKGAKGARYPAENDTVKEKRFCFCFLIIHQYIFRIAH